ncbi:hypothetical protein BST13_21205 [Mycobacterium aquaticum]|uniref:Uncharacterized protein n=1 Tax=Mycobacterium aquaticum TaxID=1927124 RepID=A0A1X0ASN4_9MYCO|nr:hypothetical protein BST13_21205 [Mycobacterium aquaticum]
MDLPPAPAQRVGLPNTATATATAMGEDCAPRLPLLRRLLKHPRMMHYNRLIVFVVIVNLGWAVYGATAGNWWTSQHTGLSEIAFMAQTNLAAAVLFRQQYILNAAAWLATRAPKSWPLQVRWTLGKYFHLGGLHVGTAVAGTLWYLALATSMIRDAIAGVGDASGANTIFVATLATTFSVMVVMALPRLRAAQHDRFEITHRFCGWTALILMWINTLFVINGDRGGRSFGAAMLTAPAFWLVVASAGLAIWPWLLLRRVPVGCARPSSHAMIVRLNHRGIPRVGTTRAISRHPLVGWHHFANVPAAPGTTGYRMLVSRAGDWTSEFVDNPPTHVWVRGIPAVGVANVRRLFSKVVIVATGSGIGPLLGHLLDTSVPAQLVWVTKNPRLTYGEGFVEEIEAAQPDAIIWDTDALGKPDVLQLAYRAYVESGAEAVICVANRTVTEQVVHGFEQCGIPAFGPIWDS